MSSDGGARSGRGGGRSFVVVYVVRKQTFDPSLGDSCEDDDEIGLGRDDSTFRRPPRILRQCCFTEGACWGGVWPRGHEGAVALSTVGTGDGREGGKVLGAAALIPIVGAAREDAIRVARDALFFCRPPPRVPRGRCCCAGAGRLLRALLASWGTGMSFWRSGSRVPLTWSRAEYSRDR